MFALHHVTKSIDMGDISLLKYCRNLPSEGEGGVREGGR